MLLKFETLEKFRGKYDELNYYLIEYEGFIEDNGAPFCDFLLYRNKKERFNPKETLINGVKRAKNILKSFSRKIEFGDILKRVQETIRRERAEEKKKKKKRFNNDNKPLNQTQANGKMIAEIKNDIKTLKEILENLVQGGNSPEKDNFNEEKARALEESHFSSQPLDNANNQNNGIFSHDNSINLGLGADLNRDDGKYQKSATQLQTPMDEDWD